MMVHLLSTLLLLFTLSPNPVTSELALESGYSVSTVIDFNKYENPSIVHPFALLPRRRSTAGDDALLLLDSTNSAFYSLPIPISQESEVRLFSGKGVAGFSDGDKTTAMFNKPRSFAIDGGDNVYVADKTNRAIRKINPSGKLQSNFGAVAGEGRGHINGPGLCSRKQSSEAFIFATFQWQSE